MVLYFLFIYINCFFSGQRIHLNHRESSTKKLCQEAVSVVVTLAGHVVRQLFVSRKPAIDVRKLLADVIALVVPWGCGAHS